MKNKIMKALITGVLSVMFVMPCGVKAYAAEAATGSESVAITETTSSRKIFKNLDKLKAQIAGLLNIDIGDIEKIIVSTKDDVKVILKDSNIDIKIDIHLIDININK